MRGVQQGSRGPRRQPGARAGASPGSGVQRTRRRTGWWWARGWRSPSEETTGTSSGPVEAPRRARSREEPGGGGTIWTLYRMRSERTMMTTSSLTSDQRPANHSAPQRDAPLTSQSSSRRVETEGTHCPTGAESNLITCSPHTHTHTHTHSTCEDTLGPTSSSYCELWCSGADSAVLTV